MQTTMIIKGNHDGTWKTIRTFQKCNDGQKKRHSWRRGETGCPEEWLRGDAESKASPPIFLLQNSAF